MTRTSNRKMKAIHNKSNALVIEHSPCHRHKYDGGGRMIFSLSQ